MPQLTITNCATCPYFRPLDGDINGRGVCTDSATASDVKRGHWEVGTDCIEKLEALITPQPEAPTPTATIKVEWYSANSGATIDPNGITRNFAVFANGEISLQTRSGKVIKSSWSTAANNKHFAAIRHAQVQRAEAAEALNAYEEVWGNGRIYDATEISEVVTVAEDGLVTINFSNGLTKTFAQTEYNYLLMVSEPESEIGLGDDYLTEFEKRSEAQERGTGFLAALSYQETQAEADYNNLMYLEHILWQAISKHEATAPGSQEEAIAQVEIDKAQAAINRFTRTVNTPHCLSCFA